MRLLGLLISLLIVLEARAQQPGTPPPQTNTAPGLTPTEMDALQRATLETEAKSKQQQQNQPQNPQPNPAPQVQAPAPVSEPPAAQTNPEQAPTPLPPPNPALNLPPTSAPVFQAPPTNGGVSGNGANNIPGNRNKSPFMIPTELYNRVKQMQTVKTSPSEGTVDSQIEVRRRWPLRDYTLVAVMWDVKSPKAMIADRENKLHVFRVKDYIANSEGYVSEITNGEVIVVERGAEIKLKLKSR